jgi:hypothetical protein
VPAKRVVAKGLAAVLAMTLSGCGSPGPSLRVAGDASPVLVEEANVPAAETWSFTTDILCLTGPGQAIIDDVAMHEPTGGLHVDAFALRPNPFPTGGQVIGAGAVPLASLNDGYIVGRQTIETVCPTAGQEESWTGGREFAIQVSKPSAGPAYGLSLDVSYESGGAHETLTIPFGVALCGTGPPADCPSPDQMASPSG